MVKVDDNDADGVPMEQRFVDSAFSALDREIEQHSQLDFVGGADANAASSIRRTFDARAKKLKLIGDGVVSSSYLFRDPHGLLDDVQLDEMGQIHVGVQHLETNRGAVLDWRSEVAESLQFGMSRLGITVIRRRTIQVKRRRVIAVQSEWVESRNTPEDIEFGRVAGARVAPAGNRVSDTKSEEVRRATNSHHPGDVQGGDILLAELEASRDGHMRQAVATIQFEQNRAIRSPADIPLVIEGGPGTGKTLVGLHRVAKILYDLSSSPEKRSTLVVGPNPHFIEYISDVLPSLGEPGAHTFDIASLCLDSVAKRQRPTVIGEETDPLIARVKGDPAMETLLRRVAWSRVKVSELRLRVNERLVVLSEEEVAEIIARAEQAFFSGGSSYQAARDSVALQLDNRASERSREAQQRLVGGSKDRSARKERRKNKADDHAALTESRSEEVGTPHRGMEAIKDEFNSDIQVVGTGKGRVTFDELARQLLPDVQPLALVKELLTSPTISDAIDDPTAAMTIRNILSRAESDPWTRADLPLIDESAHVLGLVTPRYQHVVIDEAQDLSALAWRAIARRLSGRSLTILGDLNQSTDPAAVKGWSGALDALGIEEADVLTLAVSYRLPKPILEYAVKALPKKDRRYCPVGLRDGEPPTVRKLESPPEASEIMAALEIVPSDQYVGVITTEPRLSQITQSRDGTVILRPDEVKGLEFDVAVVVEPGHWCNESEEDYRRLFIALSRPTRRLIVLHHDPLPQRLR